MEIAPEPPPGEHWEEYDDGPGSSDSTPFRKGPGVAKALRRDQRVASKSELSRGALTTGPAKSPHPREVGPVYP